MFWLILDFLNGFAKGLKFAFYSADVSSAFDRVSRERFLYKLCCKGLDERFLRVVAAWLETRTAVIRVDGASSSFFDLREHRFRSSIMEYVL